MDNFHNRRDDIVVFWRSAFNYRSKEEFRRELERWLTTLQKGLPVPEHAFSEDERGLVLAIRIVNRSGYQIEQFFRRKLPTHLDYHQRVGVDDTVSISSTIAASRN